MQINLILFKSFLLTTAFFVSTAMTNPVSATEPKEADTEQKLSEIPNLRDMQFPEIHAQFLIPDVQADSRSIAQTPTTTPISSQEADIELEVIGTPLVNFIEERQNSPTGVIILDQREIQRFN